MYAPASTVLIALFGIATLTALGFAPTSQARTLAILVPPWRNDGLARAAATGLAIVDLHWRQRVIIIDTGGDPNALAKLREQSLWILGASGAFGCSTNLERA